MAHGRGRAVTRGKRTEVSRRVSSVVTGLRADLRKDPGKKRTRTDAEMKAEGDRRQALKTASAKTVTDSRTKLTRQRVAARRALKKRPTKGVSKPSTQVRVRHRAQTARAGSLSKVSRSLLPAKAGKTKAQVTKAEIDRREAKKRDNTREIIDRRTRATKERVKRAKEAASKRRGAKYGPGPRRSSAAA